MRKSCWLFWFSSELPEYLLIILSVILLLAGLSQFVSTVRLYEQAEIRHLTIEVSWWLERITRGLLLLTFALWSALSCYKYRLRNKLDTIKRAIQIKKVVSALWWLTIFILVLFSASVFTAVYYGTHRQVFDGITFLLIAAGLLYTLLGLRVERRYLHKEPLCNTVAAWFFEQHNKFFKVHDFNKAHTALVKACETAPDIPMMWCKLALFCEVHRKNVAEADRYIAKAEELIRTEKASSDSARAYYLSHIGMILYNRREYSKGLEHMKQSIDIEPLPGLISLYEKMLVSSETLSEEMGEKAK